MISSNRRSSHSKPHTPTTPWLSILLIYCLLWSDERYGKIAERKGLCAVVLPHSQNTIHQSAVDKGNILHLSLSALCNTVIFWHTYNSICDTTTPSKLLARYWGSFFVIVHGWNSYTWFIYALNYSCMSAAAPVRKFRSNNFGEDKRHILTWLRRKGAAAIRTVNMVNLGHSAQIWSSRWVPYLLFRKILAAQTANQSSTRKRTRDTTHSSNWRVGHILATRWS